MGTIRACAIIVLFVAAMSMYQTPTVTATTKHTVHHNPPPTTEKTTSHHQPHLTTKHPAHHNPPRTTKKTTSHHQPHPTTKHPAHHNPPPTTKTTTSHHQPHPTTKHPAHHNPPPTTKKTTSHHQPHPTTKHTAHHNPPPTTKKITSHHQPHPTTKHPAHHNPPPTTKKTTSHHQPHPTSKHPTHHNHPPTTKKTTPHHQPHPTIKHPAHHNPPPTTKKTTPNHQPHPTIKHTVHHNPPPTTKKTTSHHQPHPTIKHTEHHNPPQHTIKHGNHHPTTKPGTSQQSNSELAELKKQVDYLEKVIGGMARQMMLQQLFVEERIRSDGDSGIKQIRYSANDGARPYYLNTFSSGGAVAAVHEHANYDRTVGLGEFVAVMNGVEFRTRHNDYKLRMPSPHDKSYHKMEDVPFPDVPPSVLGKHTVAEQIAEMRKYFEAFHKQDKRIRNYEPYFKPALCYLEGAWTLDTKTLSEPFHSDRHFIDASSWFDLQEKVRYTAYTGGKSNFENYSFLPTTIINVTEHGQPVYAQWNYRILCHPVKTTLKLQDFQLVDDLGQRMRMRKNITAFGRTRAARFHLAGRHGSHYNSSHGYGHFKERYYGHGLIDRIMGEIPGKDNYPGYMEDNSFSLLKYRMDTKNNTKLNTAFYHRYYKVLKKGAMGLTVRHRGFSDGNLWVASTTQPRIAELGVKDCNYDQHVHKRVCHNYKSRYTYAVPLESIWLTPLSKWNPYNLYMHEYRHRSDVSKNGRNGGFDNTHAYNGTSLNAYYLTPADFFHPGEVNRDPADTARDTVGVLDQQGNVRRMVATGTRIFLPEIPGVGIIRQRYPIMPAHTEGSTTEKNLDALQDIVMQMKNYGNMFEENPDIGHSSSRPADSHYVMSTTHYNPPGMHYHDLYLTPEQMHALKRNGTQVHVYTTHSNGHSHELVLQRDSHRKDTYTLMIVTCDGIPTCWDHHQQTVFYRKD